MKRVWTRNALDWRETLYLWRYFTTYGEIKIAQKWRNEILPFSSFFFLSDLDLLFLPLPDFGAIGLDSIRFDDKL